jgi:hypothetical protein
MVCHYVNESLPFCQQINLPNGPSEFLPLRTAEIQGKASLTSTQSVILALR